MADDYPTPGRNEFNADEEKAMRKGNMRQTSPFPQVLSDFRSTRPKGMKRKGNFPQQLSDFRGPGAFPEVDE